MIHSLEHAVIIGKFYPFHKGHYFLIHSASTIAKKVTVVVLVDTARETLFPFEERATYVQNGISTYSRYGTLENVNVVTVFHQSETNYDSDDTWENFANLVREGISKSAHKVAASHLVVADPTYGERLANMLQLQYVDLYDERKLYPISATMIRNEPFKYWDFLNPDVRENFTKRVVILGAESSGTTTLTEDLHNEVVKLPDPYFNAEIIYEYGREYIQNKLKLLQTSIEKLDITSEEIEFFAEKQALQENNVVRQTGCPLIFCDTDALASQVWHKRYVGHYSDKIEKLIESQSKRTLFVLTSMDGIELEFDGTRDGDDVIRKMMEKDFEKQLIKRNLPFIIVKGSRETRVQMVLNKLGLVNEKQIAIGNGEF